MSHVKKFSHPCNRIACFEVNIPDAPGYPIGLVRTLGENGLADIDQTVFVQDANAVLSGGYRVTLRGESQAELEALRDQILKLPKIRARNLPELLADYIP